jgi:hypothetical protein
MIARILKRSALALFVAGAGLAASSQAGVASTMSGRPLEECRSVCPNGGCGAQTPWYNIWDDCVCTCTAGGYPSCGCS